MVNTFILVLVALNAFLIITKMIKSFTRLHDLSNHYTFTELMDCPPSEGSFFKYVQKLLERDARGGTRYTEIVRSHFGVISPDARLQRPE